MFWSRTIDYIKNNSSIDRSKLSGIRALSTMLAEEAADNQRSIAKENWGKTPGLHETWSANNLSSKQASPFPVFDIVSNGASRSHRLTRRTFEYLWQIFNVPAIRSFRPIVHWFHVQMKTSLRRQFDLTSLGNCDNWFSTNTLKKRMIKRKARKNFFKWDYKNMQKILIYIISDQSSEIIYYKDIL